MSPLLLHAAEFVFLMRLPLQDALNLRCLKAVKLSAVATLLQEQTVCICNCSENLNNERRTLRRRRPSLSNPPNDKEMIKRIVRIAQRLK